MVSRIEFEQPILRGQEEDDKAAELGFHIDNIRFHPNERVEFLDIRAKDNKESNHWKLSVAIISSGIVTDENDPVKYNEKYYYTYRIKMDNASVTSNVPAERMRKIT